MAVYYAQVRNDFEALLRNHFDQSDIDVKELKDYIDVLKAASTSKVVEMITRADMDAYRGDSIHYQDYWARMIKMNGCKDEDEFKEYFASMSVSLEAWATDKAALSMCMAVPFSQFKADIKVILFDNIDKDGNGTLDVKELKDVINKLRDGNKGGILEMFTKADLDANGDGVITFDEFWASMIKDNGFEDEDAFAEACPSVGPVERWEREKGMMKAALV